MTVLIDTAAEIRFLQCKGRCCTYLFTFSVNEKLRFLKTKNQFLVTEFKVFKESRFKIWTKQKNVCVSNVIFSCKFYSKADVW